VIELSPEVLLDSCACAARCSTGIPALVGRHSNRFVQKFRFLEDPAFLERIVAGVCSRECRRSTCAAWYRPRSAASSGYESARQLGTRAIFVEKEGGTARFRRGFGVAPGERVLVVEDVITTGLSVREVIAVVEAEGGVVAASARWYAAGTVDVGAPLYALLDRRWTRSSRPTARSVRPVRG